MGFFEALVLVLLGVVTGAVVPALLQLRRTLRSAERFLDDTGPRLQRTLETTERAAAHVDRIAGDVENDLDRVRGVLDVTADLGRSLRQVQGSLRTVASIGAAIGPAVAAAARALFDPLRGGGREDRPPESAPRRAAAPRPGNGPEAGESDQAKEVIHE